jgi:hypothetical protein
MQGSNLVELLAIGRNGIRLSGIGSLDPVETRHPGIRLARTAVVILPEPQPVVEEEPKPSEEVNLVLKLTRQIKNMPDREDRIADLRARIASGNYKVPAEDIADAMIRHTISESA